MKNILILSRFCSFDLKGGIESVVDDYIEFFESNSFKYKLFVTSKNRDDIIIPGYIKRFKSGIYIGKNLLSVYYIYYVLKNSSKFDKIIINMPFIYGYIIPFFLKKNKIILLWHADIIRSKFIIFFINILNDLLFKRVSKIITTSHSMISGSLILKKNKKKVVVIPISMPKRKKINLISLKKIDNRISFENNFCFFVGRLSEYKGINIILGSAKKLRHINFIIAGTGSLESEIHSFIKANNINNLIFINRQIHDNEKIILMKKCKVFLFPSTNKAEAFGVTQLEAINENKPIINTFLGTGVNEVGINNINAITVEPNNLSQFSNAIQNIYDDSRLYKKLCNGARKVKKSNFNRKKISEKLIKFLNQYE